jgi:hypothetical protein
MGRTIYREGIAMTVSISPDGSVRPVLSKVDQDTLEKAVGLARTILQQLYGFEHMVASGLVIDPEQADALRRVATALLNSATGVIEAADRQAAPNPSPGLPTYTYDFGRSYNSPLMGWGQRTTMTTL